MDPRLAEIYQTNEDAADIEKTAAAELAEKLASDDELDVDNLSADELEALAQEVLSADEETTEEETETKEAAEEETEEGEEKTAEAEKLAEMDYLGRVMAHAYWQELKLINKEASADEGTEKTAGKGGALKAGLKNLKKLKKLGPKAKELAGAAKEKGRAAFKGGRKMFKSHGKHMGAAAGAGLAAGVAAGRMSKHSSAVEQLAESRALEILAENGIEVEGSGDKYEQLSNAVDARAIELLQENGYTFEE